MERRECHPGLVEMSTDFLFKTVLSILGQRIRATDIPKQEDGKVNINKTQDNEGSSEKETRDKKRQSTLILKRVLSITSIIFPIIFVIFNIIYYILYVT